MLVTSDISVQENLEWVDMFSGSLRSIAMSHQEDGRKTSSDKWGICGDLTVGVCVAQVP